MSAVREVVPLPELTRLDGSPDKIAGVINLRGEILPVVDLNLRSGHPQQPYSLEDCIIVVESGTHCIGLIVNEVQDVVNVSTDEISPAPCFSTEGTSPSSPISALIKTGREITMLMDLEELFLPERDAGALNAEPDGAVGQSPEYFDIGVHEREVFRERADTLARPIDNDDKADLIPIAVVRLGQEFFGIEFTAIKEFSEASSLTPVPCCPDHIVGQMSLRGELITVVNVATTLGLSLASDPADCGVMVMKDTGLRAAVLVDEVLDVHYLAPEDMMRLRTAPRAVGLEHRVGNVPYGDGMLSLVDLDVLLHQASLIVNEKP